MGPKTSPKSILEGSGGLLGAIFETRCFQDLIFNDFGSILGPPLGPCWGHVGHLVFDVFLKCLFEGFGLHLGSQNTSKMRPKRGSNSKHENHHFCYFFGTPFWDGFWIPCLWFWLTFGIPFGDHFGHFLGTIFASIFRPLKTSKKGGDPLPRPG